MKETGSSVALKKQRCVVNECSGDAVPRGCLFTLSRAVMR